MAEGENTEENTYCVYVHTNKINGKKYVGQTKFGNNPNRRWKDGYGYLEKNNGKYVQPRFAKAIIKYGWNNFNHEIYMDNIDKETARFHEALLIQKYNSTNEEHGYNIKSYDSYLIDQEDFFWYMYDLYTYKP